MEFEFIKGYENLYKINKDGDIFSCIYQKIMKNQEKEDGYLYVSLKKDGKRSKCYIHRLLALQYIPNPENKSTIDHIDRDRKNNKLDNLRWATIKEQANNTIKNISNLTEEQKVERKNKIREKARKWAEKNRREKGIQPKKVGFNAEEYKKQYYEKKREEKGIKPRLFKKDMTPEQIEERKIKDREYKKLKAREYREKKKQE